MEKNKPGRWISGYRVMGKRFQFSKVVWEDVTEKETFEQALEKAKQWVMQLCGGSKNSECKGPAVRACLGGTEKQPGCLELSEAGRGRT